MIGHIPDKMVRKSAYFHLADSGDMRMRMTVIVYGSIFTEFVLTDFKTKSFLI